jgi:hypothetical protein
MPACFVEDVLVIISFNPIETIPLAVFNAGDTI